MRAHGIDGPPQTEDLWISPTWEIYERWCFVRLAKFLHVHCGSAIKKAYVGRCLTLSASNPMGREFRLVLQAPFPAWDQPSASGFSSISGFRQPDIVLTVSNGSRRLCLVLDAKYRTSRDNLLDAMASAHLYHDALRVDRDRVCGALILVPKGGGARWLEDSQFQLNNRVGVFELSFDTSHASIEATISGLMAA
jgi:hypothetical protein